MNDEREKLKNILSKMLEVYKIMAFGNDIVDPDELIDTLNETIEATYKILNIIDQYGYQCIHENGSLKSIAGVPVSPHLYQVVERRANCFVSVARCEKCGAIDISWSKDPEKIPAPIHASKETDDLYEENRM